MIQFELPPCFLLVYKQTNLKNAFGSPRFRTLQGQEAELCCEGGEVDFVLRYINESSKAIHHGNVGRFIMGI